MRVGDFCKQTLRYGISISFKGNKEFEMKSENLYQLYQLYPNFAFSKWEYIRFSKIKNMISKKSQKLSFDPKILNKIVKWYFINLLS